MNRCVRPVIALLASSLCAAAPAPDTLGQFGRWGAFRGSAPARCYAIAQPGRSGRDDPAFLTVSSWPEQSLFRQIHVRLRGIPEGEVTLAIGAARYALATAGSDAWPAPADGRRIARAMRDEAVLRVTARIRGRRIADSYALAGAASAIDAADFACLRR